LPYSGKARQKYAGILKGTCANAVPVGVGVHRRRAALHEEGARAWRAKLVAITLFGPDAPLRGAKIKTIKERFHR
jgi:hypothetical protein